MLFANNKNLAMHRKDNTVNTPKIAQAIATLIAFSVWLDLSLMSPSLDVPEFRASCGEKKKSIHENWSCKQKSLLQNLGCAILGNGSLLVW